MRARMKEKTPPGPPIRNVIFDIGNVVVRWAPLEIIRLTFGETAPAQTLAERLFGGAFWAAVNRGECDEREAKARLRAEFALSREQVDTLFYYVKRTQIPIYRSATLLRRIKNAGYPLYALSDNTIEIVAYLKSQYDFWPLFEGVVISAEIGCKKPDAQIFTYLLNTYHLQAEESVFIDDMAENVAGAARLGFRTIRFSTAAECEKCLNALRLKF